MLAEGGGGYSLGRPHWNTPFSLVEEGWEWPASHPPAASEPLSLSRVRKRQSRSSALPCSKISAGWSAAIWCRRSRCSLRQNGERKEPSFRHSAERSASASISFCRRLLNVI